MGVVLWRDQISGCHGSSVSSVCPPPPVLAEMYHRLNIRTQQDQEETEDLSPLWFAGIYSNNSTQELRVLMLILLLVNNPILKDPMFLAESEDKVDPDTILLPGDSGHNLNTLEEFELDYSQVGTGKEELELFINNFVLSIWPGSFTPPQQPVQLRVHCGVWHQSPQLPRYQDCWSSKKSSSTF